MGFMKKVGLLLFLSICVQACSSSENKQKVNYYYDLESKMVAQIKLLNKSTAIFHKTTLAEGKSETKELNNIKWEKELAFFLQANINKSAFRNMYEETESQSGDTVFKTYEAKDSQLKVEKLVVGLSKNTQDLVCVEARICTDNYLYSAQRVLKLYCKDNQLQSYCIRGRQKMIFSEPEYFEITAQRK